MQLDFFKTFGINLDLAVEAHEIVRGQTGQEIPGVAMDKENYANATVTVVKILEKSAEPIMGKPRGTYITIEAPSLRENNREAHQDVVEILAKQLSKLFQVPENGNVLLVGLGNWNATPDALGPKVVENSIVTRHLYKYAPEEIRGGMRSVSALAPGVLGLTGIETAEIIKGVVEKINPELIICVDSLASRSVERIATTIQIADTGISPGSGIGNKRSGINLASMGVPVIAIGIPTVVHAAVIAQDALEQLVGKMTDNPEINKYYRGLNPDTFNGIINDILAPFSGGLTVTPKEIDSLIQNTAKIVAGGISTALHPAISAEEYSMYLH